MRTNLFFLDERAPGLDADGNQNPAPRNQKHNLPNTHLTAFNVTVVDVTPSETNGGFPVPIVVPSCGD